ncbi:hypothetical protein BBJ29_005714 [Phytophthora kernoviae]|uniref:Uncharacterized protein n=1 Tax=Phytophthora kernoviae TaxID=325452 RepID=A0A3R7JNR6_9STRA|nr:hypothetical protein BBJ29_005714 [Phytophthora kernoviae]
MSVQARIDFFENFSSGASVAPTATRTADCNRDVPFLVAFFESITTSSIPTTTPPTQLCARGAPRSATKIANVLPANEELSSSLPDTMVDHDEFVQSLYDMTVADDDQPAAEMAQTSALAPFGAVVETDYHEEPTPVSADAAKIKSWPGVKITGSRLFDFRSSPRYLQQVARLNERRPFLAQ